MGHRMTEKDAIIMATVLGAVVLVMIILVCRPFSWGTETEVAVSGGAVNESRSAVSGEALSGLEAVVSGMAVTAGDGAIINEEGMTLESRVNPPAGYLRVKEKKGSFGRFLREYELKKAGAKVKLYNGENKQNQDAHVAVFKLPIENEDLQQCADSVIRLYAEYFWETQQFDNISFQFADGFQAEYTKWRDGLRIQVAQSTSWINGGTYDDSYENFKKYLRMVFAYSSTLSLDRESEKVKLADIKAGDIFIQSGSPGHVVMIVDVCENEEGEKAFLLAQGFMPAQQFQLLKNPAHEQDEDPWYYADEIQYPLQTPEYSFKKGSLKRPGYISS